MSEEHVSRHRPVWKAGRLMKKSLDSESDPSDKHYYDAGSQAVSFNNNIELDSRRMGGCETR